ncbi:hypothetical protein [Ruminococcus sp. HUN007]|uniref:hypothetical protein n=1 Tax=Ruminococcus sp. HUN007 TaxID=1514668 RepID=UPI0005D13FFD|nr:hypothetical protein [Ruminococcus sp. HUN007]
MNKFETPEFNPNNIPLPSNDFFSFLDKEIYYIGALQDGEYNRFIKTGEEVLTYDAFQKTKFLFRWKESGYVICTADDPSMVITLRNSNEPGKFFITLERYQNRADQLWDILPHINENNQTDGICIRSERKYSGNHVYIGWDKYSVIAVKGSDKSTNLALCPLSDWVTFGLACMQYLGWSYSTDSDVGRALNNYYSNIRLNISTENALMYNNVGLIVNQAGGNFSQLRYADVYMNDVACEVIAVCNAIRLASGDFDEMNLDFFKLSLEFELSGLYKNSLKKLIVSTGSAFGIKKLSSISTKDGGWGGDPDRIASCLEGHNIKFETVHSKDKTPSKDKKTDGNVLKCDDLIRNSLCAVISYKFSTFHQAIHTFACTYDGQEIQTFNRHSDHTPSNNYLNRGTTTVQRGIYENLSSLFSYDKDSRFYVGYFLKKH